MNIEKNSDDYSCELCNKYYKDLSGLWYHNKKYHSKISIKSQPKSQHVDIESKPKVSQNGNIKDNKNKNNYSCEHCGKIYKHKQSKYRHQKICNNKNKHQELETEINNLKNKIANLETKNVTKIIKNYNNGNIINNNNSNNCGISISKAGNENVEKLDYNEISKIFDLEISSVIKLIELINFDENKPQYHSFCSTALESPYLSVYNVDTKSIDKERKKYFFEDIICKSIQKHEILFNKYKNKFMPPKRQKIIDNIKNLKRIRDSGFNDKILQEMLRNLNLLSYNKRQIIKNTWDGKSENNTELEDKEFVAILLNKDVNDVNIKDSYDSDDYDTDYDSSDSYD
jgi:hypothetical protein